MSFLWIVNAVVTTCIKTVSDALCRIIGARLAAGIIWPTAGSDLVLPDAFDDIM